jgi:hypothetical protein
MSFDSDDNDFNDDDFSEEGGDDFEREIDAFRKSPLFKKAMEIHDIVDALSSSLNDEDAQRYVSSLNESALIIPAKIAGAYGSGSWLICMQNASIIRHHAEYLHTATSGLKMFTKADKQYVKVLRDEMEVFRTMFKEWVKGFSTLERDDFEDEWGLFVRK